jgi:molybdenum cofactor synthesis domain-containing protein
VVTVEIIAVGNEILLGLVQDTNSNYLCRVVRGMGGRVRHIAVVKDEIDSVAEEVCASVGRRADLVLTCGGLGPTDDDLTLAGVARALGLKTELNPAARDFVERRYSDLHDLGHVSSARMTESRLKMARLPEGAEVIENPVGAAPAMVVEARGARIVSLPGVPAELKGIVEGPLQQLLSEVFGRGCYRERELAIESNDESQLAPALRRVAQLHPDVYIKSLPSRFGHDVVFRVLISASASAEDEADRMLDLASEDLIRELRKTGVREA